MPVRTLSVCPAFAVTGFRRALLTLGGAWMLRTTVATMWMIFVVSRRTITLRTSGTGVHAEYGISIGRCIGRLPLGFAGPVRALTFILIAIRTIVATVGRALSTPFTATTMSVGARLPGTATVFARTTVATTATLATIPPRAVRCGTMLLALRHRQNFAADIGNSTSVRCEGATIRPGAGDAPGMP